MSRLIMRARIALAVLNMAIGPLLVGAPDAAAVTPNYGEFSRLFERSAGQIWADDRAASQFAWSPESSTVSRVSWGDPAAWPPATDEKFVRDGDWILMEGYGDRTTGELVRQVATAEWIGNVDCTGMTPLAIDGRQKYARWTIPSSPYCLRTIGYIDHQDIRVNFEHAQVWWPPSGPTCSNRYISNQIGLKLYEVWRDDNGTPGGQLTEKQRRDVIYAKGIGPAFIITDWLHNWRADLRYHWTW